MSSFRSLFVFALVLSSAVLLVSAASPLPPRRASEWTSTDIGTFITSIGLEKYRSNFVYGGIDGSMLEVMTDAQLNLFFEDDPIALERFVLEYKKIQTRDTQQQQQPPKKKATPKNDIVIPPELMNILSQLPQNLRNDVEYLTLLTRPIRTWSVVDVTTFLYKNGGELSSSVSMFTLNGGINGSTLLKNLSNLKTLLPNSNETLRETLIQTIQTIVSFKIEEKKNGKSDKEEVEELLQLQKSSSSTSTSSVDLPKPNESVCTKLIDDSTRGALLKLKAQLASASAAASSSSSSSSSTSSSNLPTPSFNGGCDRLFNGGLPSRDSDGNKLLILVGRGTSKVVEQIRQNGWTQLQILALDASLNDEDDLPLGTEKELYLPTTNLLNTLCAVYHIGIRPDAIYIQDASLIDLFPTTGSSTGVSTNEFGCDRWYDWWSSEDSKESVFIFGDYQINRPKFLNSIARRFIGQRIVVDEPCWSISRSGSQSTVTPPSSTRPSCNDTLGDRVLSNDLPLISAYMILEPSKNLDRFSTRLEDSLESFGPHIENLLLINLVENTGDLESAARIHTVLKDALNGQKQLKYTKVLSWKLSDFDNSYAKLRNAALTYLSGLNTLDPISSSKFRSIFQLHIQPDEILMNGVDLRHLLQTRRELCGPSESAYLITVNTNSSNLVLEARIFRTANHLRPQWDPDYPNEENTDGYVSSSGEMYVNWGREKIGTILPEFGSLALLGDGNNININKQIIFAPVERLMRDVGQLMAQEAELYAKLQWSRNTPQEEIHASCNK